MAVKITSVKRDTKREDEGAWMPVPEMIDPETGEIPEFLVRGNNYVPFQNALSAWGMRNQRRGQNAPQQSADQAHREFGKIIAQHLLLNWRGISEPYSRELAEEICTCYESPVQGYVLACSREVADVNMEFDSAAAKNSARSSVGSSTKNAA